MRPALSPDSRLYRTPPGVYFLDLPPADVWRWPVAADWGVTMQCSCSRPISGPDSATSSSPAHPFPAQQPHTNTHFWSNFPTFAWFKCKSWSLVYFSSSFEFLDIKYFHVSIHIYSFLLDLSTKGHDSWGLFLETVSSQQQEQQQECTVTQFTPDTSSSLQQAAVMQNTAPTCQLWGEILFLGVSSHLLANEHATVFV